MKEQIFRKSSLDRVNSPEQLNEYIRVANPSVWLVLAAVALLLSGVCVWGVFGRIETTVKMPVEVQGETVTGYLSAGTKGQPEAGMEVRIGESRGIVLSISDEPIQMEEGMDPQILYTGGFSQGAFCYQVQLSINGIPEGVYEAEVVLESIAPVRFVIQ